MRKRAVIIMSALVVLLLLLGLVAWLTKPKAALAAKVSITGTGFVPTTLHVRKGTKVTWTNTDTKPHRVASNPYPAHSDLPGLYADNDMAPRASYSYTFTTTGAHGYHDYLYPTLSGVVVVE